MKSKNLLLMLVLLVILGWVAWKQAHPPAATSTFTPGQDLLADFDPNAVTELYVGAGTQSVTLARSDAAWVVPDRWNYPADFDRLRQLLRTLDDLKVGDQLRGSPAEFGLDPQSNPTTLRWKAGGQELALILGGNLESSSPDNFRMPDSQFVQLQDSPVLLVTPMVDRVSDQPEEWIDRQILDLDPANLQSIHVQLADGTRYGVERDGDGFRGLDALDGKSINKDGADLWTRAFRNLTCANVLDPASDHAALGLDQPDRVEVHAKDGLQLTIQLGKQNDQGERAARFVINWQAPTLPEGLDEAARANLEKEQQATSEKAMALQKRVGPWIYQLSASTANPLTILQAQLVVRPEEPKSD